MLLLEVLLSTIRGGRFELAARRLPRRIQLGIPKASATAGGCECDCHEVEQAASETNNSTAAALVVVEEARLRFLVRGESELQVILLK